MAGLIQYLVYCKTVKKSLVNWKISSVHPTTLTFSEFYKEEVMATSMVPNRHVPRNAVFVSGSKEDCTSEVDINLSVVEVSRCFGQYVKFYVESTVESSSGTYVRTY